ncbi:hypothetical protein EVAR_27390_1 [Eumeta japonica]|uniref:Endonuclease/exonuclease/phosphatase domain-containing protein n=1 Tax=Eumeta variegata TaxID=151549 RepID=A0A4C1X2L9_EUMVA|nr:hypothetical protein EVAR_27390_1 [Eumeta japonica]
MTSNVIRCWRPRPGYTTISLRSVMYMWGSNGARSETSPPLHSARAARATDTRSASAKKASEKAVLGDTTHVAFSSECSVGHKWDEIGRFKVEIIILDSGVDVEKDQTLMNENFTATVIKAGNCRIGVMSVYFEGHKPTGPYFDRMGCVCSKLGTDKLILGGDVNPWSVWWGSEHDDARGVGLCDFFDAKGLHILKEGNTLTFEVYRGTVFSRAWWM